MIRQWSAAAGIVLMILGSASIANAWVCSTREATQVFPATTLPFGATSYLRDPDTLNDMLRFQMQYVGTAMGGPDPTGASETAPVGMYACRDAFLDQPDLQKCRLAVSSDLRSWGWVTARQMWDAGEPAEHYQMARLTASVAGLDSTTLFNRFWVRYPGASRYVASKFRTATSNDPYTQLVAPSTSPMSWPGMGTLVTRGVSLLDLAELPDFSNSLDDWLKGNETCPIAGTENAYRGVSIVNSCHEFKQTMGAINVTHFAPMNREMYWYYHRLAKSHMRDCADLTSIVAEFYGTFNSPDNTAERPYSANDTEAHECERFAFTYEMIAQHFLQDSWSTGHMFKRWGYANYSQFPTDVLLPGESAPPDFEPENEAPRRAGIALSVAALAGTIHGAKSVVYGLAREKLNPVLADQLESWHVFDDPLSGPFFEINSPISPIFDTIERTSWTNGDQILPGAGDMFWNPPGARASVLRDSVYAEQRTTFLACAAGSMRDVYETTRHGVYPHGKPTEPTLPLLDPESDDCWEHWATNRSMLGAIGAIPLTHFLYKRNVGVENVALQALYDGLATNKILDDRAGTTPNFPIGQDGDPDLTEDQLRLIRDRDKYLQRLKIRAIVDYADMSATYAANVIDSPNGTASARNDDEVTLFNIGSRPTNDAPFDPDVDYKDPLDVTQAAVGRAFWRGNLKQTCTEPPQTILSLRDRCIAGAEHGSDADACTACVDLAELHIPTCLRVDPAATFHSKCSVVGVDNIASPPAGLPHWWFDIAQRASTFTHDDGSEGSAVDCGFQSYFVALRWCTGTTQAQFDAGDLSAYHTITTEGITTSCGVPAEPPYQERVGVASPEVNSDGTPSPFISPMVAAFGRTLKNTPMPSPKCGIAVESSQDALVQAAIAPANLWDNRPLGVRELQTTQQYNELAVPRCGTVQRVSLWNRDCLTAMGQVGSNQSLATGWNPATGAQVAEGPGLCMIREPRQLIPYCQGPISMTCTSTGQCVPLSTPAPPVNRLDQF